MKHIFHLTTRPGTHAQPDFLTRQNIFMGQSVYTVGKKYIYLPTTVTGHVLMFTFFKPGENLFDHYFSELKVV